MKTSNDDQSQRPAADNRSTRECFDAVASRYPRAELRPTNKEQGLAVADQAFRRALSACTDSDPLSET